MCPSFIKFGSNCFTQIEDFVGVTYIRTEGTDGRSDVRMDGPTLVLFRVHDFVAYDSVFAINIRFP